MKTLLHRWLFPVATGLILASAYPPFNISQSAWFALVFLLFAVEECPAGEAFRRGCVAGLVFFGATVWWTIHVTLPGMVALVAFLAVYFGAAAWWFALVFRLVRRDDTDDRVWANLVMMALGAAGWVTLEWIRGQFPLGGFGWNNLGVSQWQTVPLIQFASYTGVYGVSALLCLVNGAIYCTVRRFWRQIGKAAPVRRLSWEFYTVMILVCLALMSGMRQIQTLRRTPPARVLRLALVQGNIPQNLKFDPNEKPMILDRYRTLTAIATLKPVDLIIWPETATPGALRYDRESYDLATNTAVQAHAFLLTGTIDVTPSSTPPAAYNAAGLVRPDGRLAYLYRKIHLVPFGEYVPLRKIFPFMKWLTPIQDSFERGSDPAVFMLDWAGQSASFGTVICFEDTLPELYRQFTMRGVDFMVNVTNDGWFKRSPAAELHLANAVFRAVETRRPLVRSTNNGITCVVDEFGSLRTALQPFIEGYLVCDLPLREGLPTTFYTRYGNVFVSACVLLTGLTGLVVWRQRKQRPTA